MAAALQIVGMRERHGLSAAAETAQTDKTAGDAAPCQPLPRAGRCGHDVLVRVQTVGMQTPLVVVSLVSGAHAWMVQKCTPAVPRHVM